MPEIQPHPLDRAKVLEAVADGSLEDYNSREVAWRVLPRMETGKSRVSRLASGTVQEKAFDQFWTRPSILRDVSRAWDLTAGATPTVYDPAVGTGAAWIGLKERIHLTGLDLDPEIVAIANVLHPKALIRTADLMSYRPVGAFDLAGGAPPFRCTLLDRTGHYYTAGEAGFGPSHGFYIEQCLSSLRENGLALFILPRNWHRLGPEKLVVKAAKRAGTLLARVELPPGSMSDGQAADLYLYSRAKLKGVRSTVVWVHDFESLQEALTDALARPSADGLREALDLYREGLARREHPVEVEALDMGELPEVDVELPLTETVEVEIIPNGDRTIVKPNGRQAAVRLASLDRSSGRIHDAKRQTHTTRWRELLREPWEFAGQEVVRSLRSAGITPVIKPEQVKRLERRARWAEIQMTPFEQWVQDKDGNWTEAFAESGLRARYPDLYQENVRRMERLGLTDVLYPYQVDDVARMAMKTRFELGSDVGTGKSIEYMAYVLVRDIQRAGVICNSRLIGKWIDEIEAWKERLPHLADRMSYKVVQTLSDVGDVEDGRLVNFDGLKGVRFVLLSYESLWRIPKDSRHRGRSQYTSRKIAVKPKKKGDPVTYVTRKFWHPSKYSLAHELRRVFANGALLADEAYRLKDMDAKQTSALVLLNARCRVAACATMIRNYIDDLLPILNWLYGERGLLFRRYGHWQEGEVQRWIERFGTYVYFRYSDPTRSDSRKMLPKIANADAFRAMHAPMQIRRMREEPLVRPYVGAAEPRIRHESVPLSSEHRAYYEELQSEFATWWAEYLEAQKDKGRDVNPSQILAKLGVLQRASTCPGMESLSIEGHASITYQGGLTSKMNRAIELCRAHVARGEKVVLFGQYKHGLHVLAAELDDLNPVLITGDVSLVRSRRTRKSKRDRELDAFRTDPDRNVLVATQKCMTEGYDLYEANVAIFVESDWTPSVDKQALGRLRRPQQKRPVTAYFLTHSGTVDEYVCLISGAKGSAHAEALDGQDYELKIDMIPDVQDYANGILDGLSLDDIRPERRIARIQSGDVELFNEERDGLLQNLAEVEQVYTRRARLSNVA